MAIKKGIESGDLLWKYEETYKYPFRNVDDDGRAFTDYRESVSHRGIYLTTRRARTIGAEVPEEAYPFLDSLGIKLVPRIHTANQKTYTAVGTVVRRLPEHTYHELDVCPRARISYRKLTNEKLALLLERYNENTPQEIIEEMKSASLTLTEEVNEWPPEPEIPVDSTRFTRHAGHSRF